MRQHSQIIDDAGGYVAFAKELGLDAQRVRFWRARSSIPAQFWLRVCAADLSNLAELAAAVSIDGLGMSSDTPAQTVAHTRNGAADSGQPAGESVAEGDAG